MRYIKMLSLAALAAAALMAFLGASSASATVLCKTTPTDNGSVASCPSEWDYGVGTEIEATIKSGDTALLEASPVSDTCPESKVKGTTAHTGGASETVDGNISTLDWSASCTCTTTTITNGSLEIHRIPGTHNGTLTGKNSEVTVVCPGLPSCVYGTAATGTDLGKVTQSATASTAARMDIEATLPKKGGSFLCPSTGSWSGNYTITSPIPLYIADTG